MPTLVRGSVGERCTADRIGDGVDSQREILEMFDREHVLDFGFGRDQFQFCPVEIGDAHRKYDHIFRTDERRFGHRVVALIGGAVGEHHKHSWYPGRHRAEPRAKRHQTGTYHCETLVGPCLPSQQVFRAHLINGGKQRFVGGVSVQVKLQPGRTIQPRSSARHRVGEGHQPDPCLRLYAWPDNKLGCQRFDKGDHVVNVVSSCDRSRLVQQEHQVDGILADGKAVQRVGGVQRWWRRWRRWYDVAHL
jgi:hypothetical protein